MRQLNITFLIGLLLCFTPWAKAQEAATVSPAPLEVRGDSVRFTVTVNMPANKKMGDAGTLVVNPRLGDYKYDYFPATPLKVTNASKSGVSQSVDVAIPFIEDMIGNEVDVDILYTAGDKTIKKEVDDIAPCCITTGMLFLDNSQFQFATIEQISEGGKDPKKLMAQFNFPLDIEKLDPSEYQKSIKQIGDFLKKYPDSDVTVRGFASPEGPYDRNVYLSEQRSKRAAEWLQVQLDKHGYGKWVTPDNFSVEVTHEDWRGFMTKLRQSERFANKAEEVEDIVSSGMAPMEMEKAVLNELGYTWEQRHAPELEELFKPLRRSIVVLETNEAMRPALTEAQVDSIVEAYAKGNIPKWKLREILSQEQWLDAAQETYARSGEMSLLLGYYDVYPDDYRIINDLAILDLMEDRDPLAGNGLAIIGGDDALVGVIGGEYDLKWKRDVQKNPYKFQYNVKYEDGPESELEILYKGNDFEGALPMLELAYEMEREDWAVLSNLGAAYFSVANYPKAQMYLERSVSLRSTPEAQYNLGLTYARRGMYSQAVSAFNKANTETKGLYYNRGLSKMLNGDLTGARQDLQKHIALYPDHAIGHYLLAIAGARSGDADFMAEHLRHAISLKNILSDISQEDLEFRNYWDTELFEKASDDDPKD